MTEPDEALLWAREDAAAEWEKDGFSDLASKCRSGKYDPSLAQDAYAYRAGQAASAARIKELEARVAELEKLSDHERRIKALERLTGSTIIRPLGA